MTLHRPTRLAPADRIAVDAALADAFAPLRVRSANIGAARIRAAVRWARPEPPPARGLALVTRIGELLTAAAVSAFLIGGSLGSMTAGSAFPDVSRDAVSAGQWTLNGRAAFQRPIGSRTTDRLDPVGDGAANAATVRREASRSDRSAGQTSTNR